MIKQWKLVQKIAHYSVRRLTQLAAILALAALTLMVLSVLFPRPLLVIAAMSVGHVIGAAAFACYLLAIVLDTARSTPPPDSLSPERGPRRGAAQADAQDLPDTDAD